MGTDAAPKYPRLPKRADGEPWSKDTRKRWKDIWCGTVGQLTFEPSDYHGLLDLAELWQRKEFARNTRELTDLSREIRQQESRWGLDARSRQALRYEVVKAGDSEDRRTKRRRPKAAAEVDTSPQTKDTDALSQADMLKRLR